MSTTINFSGPIAEGYSVSIYRSNAILDKNSLPPPIATINTVGATSWTDPDGKWVSDMWYMLAITTPSNKTFYSAPKKLTSSLAKHVSLGGNDFYTTLIDGVATYESNERLGSIADVTAAIGNTAGVRDIFSRLLPTATVSGSVYAGKIVRNGKTFIVPLGLVVNTTWATAYAAGCVFGVDDDGSSLMYGGLPSGITPTPQTARVTILDAVYRVRLLRGLANTPEEQEALYVTPADTTNRWYGSNSIATDVSTEFDDLFIPLLRAKTHNKRISQHCTSWNIGGAYSNLNGLYSMSHSQGGVFRTGWVCQDLVLRGGTNAGDATAYFKTSKYSTVATNTTGNLAFVLELEV